MVPDFWLILIVVTVSGFIMDAVDAAMGMGYGTVLTLILLLMGFDPLQILLALLISQLIGARTQLWHY